jgi:PPM family protein phosphatase
MGPVTPAMPLSPAVPVHFDIAGRTHTGYERDGNEDAWGACRRTGILFVADGLGGEAAGEVASRMAGDCVMEAAAALRDGHTDLARQLFDHTVQRAGRLLREYEEAHPDAMGLATTLTAAWLHEPGRARILHIGDSRAYLLRNGELTPLTTDHSEVGDMVRFGELTREQARIHPLSFVITRCISSSGAYGGGPDILEVDVRAGDVLLLTTDGLTDMVRESRMESICRRAPDIRRMLRALERAALKAGGHDNITAAAARVVAAAT